MTPWDPSDYPADWADIRDRVLARAGACCNDHLDPAHPNGGACEWCGAENGQPHPKTGSQVVLTIAHVYDRRPHVTDLPNLAALCQRCHLRHDAKMHARPAGAKATGIGRQSTLTIHDDALEGPKHGPQSRT